jgi:hypothetical protein
MNMQINNELKRLYENRGSLMVVTFYGVVKHLFVLWEEKKEGLNNNMYMSLCGLSTLHH